MTRPVEMTREKRLLAAFLVVAAATALAGAAEQPADEAARLLKAAAHQLGLGSDPGAPAKWEAVHAVEGDGLMLRGVPPEVCAAAESQSARTQVRLQAGCHRQGADSILIIFVAQ